MKNTDHTREIITRLLSSMGGAREIRQYLKRYGNGGGRQFALVKVGGAILRDEMDVLASALGFLHTVGLMPVVIHGAGPQADVALKEAGVKIERVDGLRVTSAETLEVIRRTFRNVSLELVRALGELDVGATPISGGVFQAEFRDREKLGFVGEPTGIDLTPVRASIEAGRIPVLAPLAETPSGQILNVNSDTAAARFVLEAQPQKIVFLTSTGGLLDDEGRIIENINLATDYDELMAQDWLDGGMRLKLQEIASFLEELPLTASVSMTRPAELAKELFTHGGAGTLIRKGEAVDTFTDWADVDHERLQALIESAFGKTLSADYFERTALHAAYISSSYRSAAVMSEHGGISFLDKFAVEDSARGEGLGRTVWHLMCARHPKLFWRSRRANPVNAFYFEESDGCYKAGEWIVFWRGLEGHDEIRACTEAALGLPATLV